MRDKKKPTTGKWKYTQEVTHTTQANQIIDKSSAITNLQNKQNV